MVASAQTQTMGSQRSAMGPKAVMKTRSRIAKAAALGPTERNAGDGGGRALIDVGSPDLERRGGNLEAEADEHQGGGGSGQRQRTASRSASALRI